MGYQVLARKWRPRVFKEMVGQEHVLKALINALDHNRLHHAYLFTGTRGVGKTTIARILAKCLNCEQGVTSEPCDQCTSCVEINEGRFVDLIEVDAASRTKVEDTRELLDNVQYAPSKGRFKVYLIDEVHMLSGHSFNALLKTLEEPPPHVKFLLATTDPQKLPVTILSRCLQFNLKNMTPERIVAHLQYVLEQESIPFETSALWQLGRSADGSMRDALSLTDQAIAFGEGKISEDDVNTMLGSIDRTYIMDILQALCGHDGTAILQHINRMSEHSPDYEQALAEFIVMVHRLAIAQVLPESIDNTFGDRDQVLTLAKNLTGEDVQLFYQTALLGRRDLPLAPDPRGGFEMVMLRLLAFKPESISGVLIKPPVEEPQIDNASQSKQESQARDTASKTIAEEAKPVKKPEVVVEAIKPSEPAVQLPDPIDTMIITESAIERDPTEPKIIDANSTETNAIDAHSIDSNSIDSNFIDPNFIDPNFIEDNVATAKPVATHSNTGKVEDVPVFESKMAIPIIVNSVSELDRSSWNDLVAQLSVGGVIGNTLSHCEFIGFDHDQMQLVVDQQFATLYDQSHQQRIAQALGEHFGQAIIVEIQVGEVSGETPAAQADRLRTERQEQALQSMRADPLVQDIIQTFSATLQEDSVLPVDH